MKKFVMILFVVSMVMGASTSFACHITFEQENLKEAKVGDTLTIKAVVQKEHRRCVLEDTDVQVEHSENIKILSETGWTTVGRNEIHNTFEVEILDEGEVTVRVFRECSKKGISEETLTFQAVE